MQTNYDLFIGLCIVLTIDRQTVYRDYGVSRMTGKLTKLTDIVCDCVVHLRISHSTLAGITYVLTGIKYILKFHCMIIVQQNFH